MGSRGLVRDNIRRGRCEQSRAVDKGEPQLSRRRRPAQGAHSHPALCLSGVLAQQRARVLWPQGAWLGSWEGSEWDERALSDSVSFLLLTVTGITPFLI